MNIRKVHSTTRRRIGLGMTLGLAAGMAVGQNVTIPWPTVTYKGSLEIRGYPNDNTCIQLYTPPAGLKLRVTSFLLDSYGSTVPVRYQYICTGKPVCSAARSAYITAPPNATMPVTLTSGILVDAGDTLSVCNYGGVEKVTSWTFYGFLYK